VERVSVGVSISTKSWPGLVAGGFVELERQRCALPQHRQRRRVDLHVAGGDLGVGVAVRTDLDDPGHRDAELRTQAVRRGQHVTFAEHHLRHAGRVPQIDEDDAAVVTSAGHPAGQRDRLSGVGGPQ
jgi:hypothetical protein